MLNNCDNNLKLTLIQIIEFKLCTFLYTKTEWETGEKTYIKECTVIIVCSPRSTFVHSCNWWRRLQRLLKAQNGVPCGYHNTQVCSSTQCYHTRRPSLVIVAAGHLHVGSQYNLQFVVRFPLVIIRFTRGQMVSLNIIRFILY